MIDIDNLVIIVEDNVPMDKRKRNADPKNDPRAQKLMTMNQGDSFFVAGASKPIEIRALTALGKKVGVELKARFVEADEIYQTSGLRVWRMNENTEQAAADQKVKEEVTTAPQNHPGTDAAKRYFHHAESEVVLTLEAGEPEPEQWARDGVEEVDYATYKKWKDKYDDDL